MELSEFIEGSLVEIAMGVRNANVKIKAELNREMAPFELMSRVNTKDNRSAVEFDVAVTASSSESTTGGGGFHISVVRAGLEAGERRGEERVTRIKFQVTIASDIR